MSLLSFASRTGAQAHLSANNVGYIVKFLISIGEIKSVRDLCAVWVTVYFFTEPIHMKFVRRFFKKLYFCCNSVTNTLPIALLLVATICQLLLNVDLKQAGFVLNCQIIKHFLMLSFSQTPCCLRCVCMCYNF